MSSVTRKRRGSPPEQAPQRLHEAMRYAVFNGGKRVRPLLTCTLLRALGDDPTPHIDLIAAVELVHTYSLIHDDLPAMDDDDLRRGRPTCHVAFDEATAILAGDALLTRAFGVLARARGIPVPPGGFVVHRGRWMTEAEKQEAELREAIAIDKGRRSGLLKIALNQGAGNAVNFVRGLGRAWHSGRRMAA